MSFSHKRVKKQEPRTKTKYMRRHNFKKMKIWQEAMTLVQITYRLVKQFPETEKFNLVSQLTRCAVSIPSNIAEGTSKRTDKHFSQFLDNSLGSAFEWETQLVIAFKRNTLMKNNFRN